MAYCPDTQKSIYHLELNEIAIYLWMRISFGTTLGHIVMPKPNAVKLLAASAALQKYIPISISSSLLMWLTAALLPSALQ